MREATGPGREPLPRAAHVLQSVIERAAHDHQSGDHTPDAKIFTLFEGTSEIQRLTIARAISGVRIR